MTFLAWGIRIAISIVAIIVLYGLAPVITNEWRGLDACPKLGPLPACYLVAVCYFAIGVASLAAPRRLTWLFAMGWLPVFGLAFSGTSLEIFGRPTCPATSAGVPMCYFSLAIALVLLVAFLFVRRGTLHAA